MSNGSSNNRTIPLIIGGLCVVLAVLVWQVIPRSPEAYAEPDLPVALDAEVDSDPVQDAINQVNGPNPMAGILALKALAEATPPNVDAVIELGRFSIQSGQIDKARERFAQAIELAPDRSEPLTKRQHDANVLQPGMLANGVFGVWITRLSPYSDLTRLAVEAASPLS